MTQLYQVAVTCKQCQWTGTTDKAFRGRTSGAALSCPACYSVLPAEGNRPPPPKSPSQVKPRASKTLTLLESLSGRQLNPAHFTDKRAK